MAVSQHRAVRMAREKELKEQVKSLRGNARRIANELQIKLDYDLLDCVGDLPIDVISQLNSDLIEALAELTGKKSKLADVEADLYG